MDIKVKIYVCHAFREHKYIFSCQVTGKSWRAFRHQGFNGSTLDSFVSKSKARRALPSHSHVFHTPWELSWRKLLSTTNLGLLSSLYLKVISTCLGFLFKHEVLQVAPTLYEDRFSWKISTHPFKDRKLLKNFGQLLCAFTATSAIPHWVHFIERRLRRQTEKPFQECRHCTKGWC